MKLNSILYNPSNKYRSKSIVRDNTVPFAASSFICRHNRKPNGAFQKINK